jgi:hypothetical protein
VVRDSIADSPEIAFVHNSAIKLGHVKREIVGARFYEIPAEAVERAAVYP